MIQVNTEKLSRVLGHEITEAMLDSDEKRMAARVITDAAETCGPHTSINNATFWIDRAKRAGFEDGVFEERGRWVDKIRRLLDLNWVS